MPSLMFRAWLGLIFSHLFWVKAVPAALASAGFNGLTDERRLAQRTGRLLICLLGGFLVIIFRYLSHKYPLNPVKLALTGLFVSWKSIIPHNYTARGQ